MSGRAAVALLLAMLLTPLAGAQTAPPGGDPSAAAPTRTGKERLGKKWSDEQRIDDCEVPVEKRGPRTRPTECGPAPNS